MQKQLQQVFEFHRLFKAHISKKPTSQIPVDVKQSRIKLIREETDELIEAIEQKDIKEIAKELADVLYVIFGTIVAFGLHNHFTKVFTRVHQSNLSKIDKKGKFEISKDGSKVLKGNKYLKPNLDFIDELN